MKFCWKLSMSSSEPVSLYTAFMIGPVVAVVCVMGGCVSAGFVSSGWKLGSCSEYTKRVSVSSTYTSSSASVGDVVCGCGGGDFGGRGDGGGERGVGCGGEGGGGGGGGGVWVLMGARRAGDVVPSRRAAAVFPGSSVWRTTGRAVSVTFWSTVVTASPTARSAVCTVSVCCGVGGRVAVLSALRASMPSVCEARSPRLHLPSARSPTGVGSKCWGDLRTTPGPTAGAVALERGAGVAAWFPPCRAVAGARPELRCANAAVVCPLGRGTTARSVQLDPVWSAAKAATASWGAVPPHGTSPTVARAMGGFVSCSA